MTLRQAADSVTFNSVALMVLEKRYGPQATAGRTGNINTEIVYMVWVPFSRTSPELHYFCYHFILGFINVSKNSNATKKCAFTIYLSAVSDPQIEEGSRRFSKLH